MKRSLLFVILLSGCVATQTWAQGSGTPTPAAGKIGASEVWQPPSDFLAKAHAACDKAASPTSFDDCFMNQMAVAGAPAAALSFTHMLYGQSDGQVGIMSAFKAFGPVDAAQVFYPLRANDNYGLLLVNGDPKVLDVDDVKKLDQAAMQQDPMFQAIKKQYPTGDLWPGDRSSSDPWPRLQPLPNGGQQFIVNYPLIEGCHACKRLGVARFGWNFDASGKFLGTTYIPTPPPPKLLKRPHGTPSQPPPPPPQAQQSPQ